MTAATMTCHYPAVLAAQDDFRAAFDAWRAVPLKGRKARAEAEQALVAAKEALAGKVAEVVGTDITIYTDRCFGPLLPHHASWSCTCGEKYTGSTCADFIALYVIEHAERKHGLTPAA